MTKNSVVKYYHTLESKLGYRLLGGVKHFGYYPEGKESISNIEAQTLMNEQLAKRLALPAGSKVLDAGCGEGGVAIHLARNHSLNVTGIDLLDFNISNATTNAKRQGVDNIIKFIQCDYSESKLPSAHFDAIYTMETLVHSPDYHRTIKEFKRLLKPNGKIVLFEYSMAPKIEIPKETENAFIQVNVLASMPAFDLFRYGVLEDYLKTNGFKNVTSDNITDRMLPMLQKFYKIARFPYVLVGFLGLRNHFVNSMSAVVFWKNRKWFRYNIISATLDS